MVIYGFARREGDMAAATAAAPPLELTITRLLDAPRALVFKVWTQPEHVAQWWGPRGFTVLSAWMDVRPGGAYRIGMRSPEGKDYWMHGVYREVAEPERLVFTFAWQEEGERGQETLVTVSFAEEAGKTRMRFRHAGFVSVAERDGHHSGWSECFDRLGAYVLRQA
jgi:uncharacterized protein YndB with AHSA1/START domain